jgi:hypothetical protein
MNDYELLQSIYETYMDGLDASTAWVESLPQVRLLCRLIDEAEKTGYISVYSDESRFAVKEDVRA